MHYRAFIEGAWRLVLASREIRRGKKKGQIEVTYRSTATLIRKIILAPDKLMPVIPMGSAAS